MRSLMNTQLCLSECIEIQQWHQILIMEHKWWMEAFAKRCQAGPSEVNLSILFTWERERRGGVTAPAKAKRSKLFEASGQGQLQMNSAGWGCQSSRGNHGSDLALRSLESQPHVGRGGQGRWSPENGLTVEWGGPGCVHTAPHSAGWPMCRPLASPNLSVVLFLSRVWLSATL